MCDFCGFSIFWNFQGVTIHQIAGSDVFIRISYHTPFSMSYVKNHPQWDGNFQTKYIPYPHKIPSKGCNAPQKIGQKLRNFCKT
jgi:hypothetical protein